MAAAEIPAPTPEDRLHLRRCVELAREALDAGDEPYGTLRVDPAGEVRFEDRNRAGSGDSTRHPEFEVARWAAQNLTPEERRDSTVYTSGEHCPMCSGAHGWVGLGRIVYASSAEQLETWQRQWGIADDPVVPLPINAIVPNLTVAGPDPELSEELRGLYARQLGVYSEAD